MVTLFNEQQAMQHIQQQLQYWQLNEAQTEQAFRFAVRNGSVHFQKLAEHLHIQNVAADCAVQQLYVLRIGDHYYIETIYNGLEERCEYRFLQQTKSLLQQHSLQTIPELFQWLQYFIVISEKYYTADEVCSMLLRLLQRVQTSNRLSSRLRMMEIVVLLYCFTSGEAYYNFVLRDIARLKRTWKRGKMALTEKERTLLSYVSMSIAHSRSQWKKVVDEARFLLKQDRFMDLAVELILDYGSLLHIAPPEPAAFIKKYRTSVFENFFFMYLEALTQLNEHQQALNVLYHYEIATTTSIYAYLQQPSEEALVTIEAAMQQNIALLVDESVRYVKQSLGKWQSSYTDIPEAFVSSKYLCIVLETLFIGEQFELFDRLMSMYVKYLKFEQHYDCLKQRISVHMALQA